MNLQHYIFTIFTPESRATFFYTSYLVVIIVVAVILVVVTDWHKYWIVEVSALIYALVQVCRGPAGPIIVQTQMLHCIFNAEPNQNNLFVFCVF